MKPRDDSESQAIKVRIFGSEFCVVSQESPDYTRRVSGFVDGRMSEIASEKNLADPTKIAIIAAMDIADGLLRHREQHRTERDRAAGAVEKLGRCLDGAIRDE